ncbi:MAG: 30S ribosomal protein S12 methylthiotransferase RimO [Burkholderiaceae bacterium]|jgi:ribosomal protein S12 methylthiotransferase|nr:30S ribosomal protein S12 methylthiotransferase RimO [Burkholderiaceae bacterium]
MGKGNKIGFVSLGCPKALVDAERILTRLRAEGYETAESYREAALVIVNTCGFISDAVEESLAAIGEAMAENGQVIVAGCLGAKKTETGQDFVRTVLPDVLEVIGPNATEAVVAAVHRYLPRPHDPFADLLPPQGIKLTPPHYAYLKIAEGCDRHCTFCVIPLLRGRLVSSPVENVLREAEILLDSGVRELLLVSQDTAAYGTDLRFKRGFYNGAPVRTNITSLAYHLGKLAKPYDAWVRLHYVYPYPYVDELVALMQEGYLLPYLDVPLQHAHPDVLRRMRRPAGEENHLERIASWRKQCPDIAIRSTFITGFPGETEAEFGALLDFLREAEIDRLGCFAYSPVEGALANTLPGAVPEAVREERRAQLMYLQEAVSRQKLQKKVGTRIRVLLDTTVRAGAIGRSFADAPEVDGVVHVRKPGRTRKKLNAGDFVNVRIDKADTHDLWGVVDERDATGEKNGQAQGKTDTDTAQ